MKLKEKRGGERCVKLKKVKLKKKETRNKNTKNEGTARREDEKVQVNSQI